MKKIKDLHLQVLASPSLSRRYNLAMRTFSQINIYYIHKTYFNGPNYFKTYFNKNKYNYIKNLF